MSSSAIARIKSLSTTKTKPKIAATIFGSQVRLRPRRVRDANASDRKRFLQHSRYRGLDLIEAQAVKVNADLAEGRDPDRWLSPRQRNALDERTQRSGVHAPKRR